MKFPSLKGLASRRREQIEWLRKKYPAGTMVELIFMEDAQSPPPGTLGRIHGVDDAGSILVSWQNGSSLSLIPEVDDFRIMKEAHRE